MIGYKFLYQGLLFEPWPRLNLNHRHSKHPMTKAVCLGEENFNWCLEYGLALCDEYTFRFGKEHKTKTALNWILNNKNKLTFKEKFIEWPRCFGLFKEIIPVTNSVVKDYQNYYNKAKFHLFKWTKRSVPDFINIL